MLRVGFRKHKKWDPDNQLGGDLFASPKELTFLNEKIVTSLLWRVYKEKPTKCQFDNVKKMLSFAHQIKTGEAGTQWKAVGESKGNCVPAGFCPPKSKLRQEIFLQPLQTQKVMTTGWRPHPDWPIQRWVVAMLIFHDWIMNGARHKEDLKRIKYSIDHFVDYLRGFMWTEYYGGRSKHEQRFGVVPWKNYRACSCVGKIHRGLPPTYEECYVLFNEDGSPIGTPTWTTECPLSCWQLIQHWLLRSAQETNRSFPRWNPDSSEYESGDLGRELLVKSEVFQLIDFQGANPNGIKYDTNGGRKANGKMCGHYKLPYPITVNWHGDQARNWKEYEPNVILPPGFKRTKQHPEPVECVRGHWMIYAHWGRGRLVKAPEPKPEPAPIFPPGYDPIAFQQMMMENIQLMREVKARLDANELKSEK
jgi:hypothetical protein